MKKTDRDQQPHEAAPAAAAAAREAYQAFRAELLNEAADDEDHDGDAGNWARAGGEEDRPPRPHPLRELRKQITGARSKLYYRHFDHWGGGTPQEPHILARQALGIPHDLRLVYPAATRILHAAVGLFTPVHMALRIARRQLAGVRSYEGRKLVFAAVVHRWFATRRRRDYSRALDFIIRQVDGRITLEQLQRLELKDLRWLRAFYKLGEHTGDRLAACLNRRLDADDAALAELLVDEKVITSADELTAWSERPDDFHGRPRSDPHQLAAARAIVRRLQGLGVARAAIAKACRDDRPAFNPRGLEETVALLSAHGVEVPPLVGPLGKLMWTVGAERWRFLLEVLRLNRAGDLVLFGELLSAQADLNTALGQALVERGTSPQGLADCQRLLMIDARHSGVPVRALQLLCAPPFSLSASEFGQVRDYAIDGSELEQFLRELARRGLTAPADVLAFERCYGRIPCSSLGPLLDVALPRRAGAPVTELADWVHRAGRIGQVEACALGAQLLRIDNLEDLGRLLTVAPLGPYVLRYLVVDKRLTPLRALVDWFYDAAGILEMQLWGPVGECELLALNDAFQRQSFTRVKHNVMCLYGASRARARARLGPRPHDAGGEVLAAYDEAMEQLVEEQRPALLHDAARVLSATGGVLFESLLESTTQAEVDARLAALVPLLDQLLAGRGPSGGELTDLEAEAIALVYETTPGTVCHHWKRLLGREGDLASLVLAPHYPMRWRRTQRRLREGARLEAKSLAALARLPGLVAHVQSNWRGDMRTACRGLRPSRFRDAAADLDGLSHHLAVLCVLAGGDDQIAESLRRWDKIRDGLLGGNVPYDEFIHLRRFFDTLLPDAVAAQAPQQLRLLSTDDANLLEERLGAPVPPVVTGAAARLETAVEATLARVQETARRWLARERGKFPQVASGQPDTLLHAVVSKSPSAFFAKQAVALCTRDDVDMWEEARHSHLVVFDPLHRCLAGMAMLYVEVVPAIDPRRPTLIIRALNPVNRFAAQHDVSSVVDAFFATAMAIAADNDLAAVAIPGSAAMDLLSNVSEVQTDILERYLRPAHSHFGRRSPAPPRGHPLDRAVHVEARFDGYACGAGSVPSLYLIWQGGEQDQRSSTPGNGQKEAECMTA